MADTVLLAARLASGAQEGACAKQEACVVPPPPMAIGTVPQADPASGPLRWLLNVSLARMKDGRGDRSWGHTASSGQVWDPEYTAT